MQNHENKCHSGNPPYLTKMKNLALSKEWKNHLYLSDRCAGEILLLAVTFPCCLHSLKRTAGGRPQL